jgi:hypothetical protein
MPDFIEISTIKRHLGNISLIVLNTLPLTFVMLLVYHLTSRLWASFSLAGALFLALQMTNRFKILLREEPLTPADFLLGMEAAKVVKISELPINLFLTAVIILFILLCIIFFMFIKSRKLSWPVRAAGAAVSIILLVSAYSTIYRSGTLYNSFKIYGSIYSSVNHTLQVISLFVSTSSRNKG